MSTPQRWIEIDGKFGAALMADAIKSPGNFSFSKLDDYKRLVDLLRTVFPDRPVEAWWTTTKSSPSRGRGGRGRRQDRSHGRKIPLVKGSGRLLGNRTLQISIVPNVRGDDGAWFKEEPIRTELVPRSFFLLLAVRDSRAWITSGATLKKFGGVTDEMLDGKEESDPSCDWPPKITAVGSDGGGTDAAPFIATKKENGKMVSLRVFTHPGSGAKFVMVMTKNVGQSFSLTRFTAEAVAYRQSVVQTDEGSPLLAAFVHQLITDHPRTLTDLFNQLHDERLTLVGEFNTGDHMVAEARSVVWFALLEQPTAGQLIERNEKLPALVEAHGLRGVTRWEFSTYDQLITHLQELRWDGTEGVVVEHAGRRYKIKFPGYILTRSLREMLRSPTAAALATQPGALRRALLDRFLTKKRYAGLTDGQIVAAAIYCAEFVEWMREQRWPPRALSSVASGFAHPEFPPGVGAAIEAFHRATGKTADVIRDAPAEVDLPALRREWTPPVGRLLLVAGTPGIGKSTAARTYFERVRRELLEALSAEKFAELFGEQTIEQALQTTQTSTEAALGIDRPVTLETVFEAVPSFDRRRLQVAIVSQDRFVDRDALASGQPTTRVFGMAGDRLKTAVGALLLAGYLVVLDRNHSQTKQWLPYAELARKYGAKVSMLHPSELRESDRRLQLTAVGLAARAVSNRSTEPRKVDDSTITDDPTALAVCCIFGREFDCDSSKLDEVVTYRLLKASVRVSRDFERLLLDSRRMKSVDPAWARRQLRGSGDLEKRLCAGIDPATARKTPEQLADELRGYFARLVGELKPATPPGRLPWAAETPTYIGYFVDPERVLEAVREQLPALELTPEFFAGAKAVSADHATVAFIRSYPRLAEAAPELFAQYRMEKGGEFTIHATRLIFADHVLVFEVDILGSDGKTREVATGSPHVTVAVFGSATPKDAVQVVRGESETKPRSVKVDYRWSATLREA